jgi:hypothetical protein
MKKFFALTFFIISVLLLSQEKRPVPDIMLTNYQYPYPVQFLDFKSQNQDLKMAYMDIKPEKPNGKTVILLHGKNFNGAYWKTTIQALTKEDFGSLFLTRLDSANRPNRRSINSLFSNWLKIRKPFWMN